MSRLIASPQIMAAIRAKAYRNAIFHNTYGTRAEFLPGKRCDQF